MANKTSVVLPASRAQLQRGGFVYSFSRPCKRCKRDLEFWRTPNAAHAPLEAVCIAGEWLMDSHFKTCPFRDEFKKPAPPQLPPVPQGDLFGGDE